MKPCSLRATRYEMLTSYKSAKLIFYPTKFPDYTCILYSILHNYSTQYGVQLSVLKSYTMGLEIITTS